VTPDAVQRRVEKREICNLRLQARGRPAYFRRLNRFVACHAAKALVGEHPLAGRAIIDPVS
jgi:hypothetical protein